MENFVLPPEYTDFVSSAQTLTNEFQLGVFEDLLTCKIYFKRAIGCNCFEEHVANGKALLAQIARAADELSREFVWSLDAFSLQMVKCISSTKDSSEDVCFVGQMRTGGNVEDEWFVVYLLQILSRQFDVCCHIFDSDGEFLLIEAADYLPSWLGPENSKHRVWIRNGKVVIISNEDVISEHVQSEGLSVSSALRWLWSSECCGTDDRWDSVNKCINKRTVDLFPARARVLRHRAVCLLPAGAARILSAYPALLSFASAAFCSAEAKEKKHLATMKFLKSASSPSQPQIDALSDLVATQLIFSKAQYAQLTFKKFSIPKSFHNSWRGLGLSLGLDNASCGPGSDVRQAFELGCRVSCGLELLYYNSKRDSVRSSSRRSFDSTVSIPSESDVVKPSQELVDIIRHRENDGLEQLLPAYTAMDDALSGGHGTSHCSRSIAVTREHKQQILAILRESSDDIAWLYVSPDELEATLAKQAQAGQEEDLSDKLRSLAVSDKQPETSSLKSVQSLSASDSFRRAVQRDADVSKLNNVVESMKSFIDNSSGLQGIEPTAASAPNQTASSLLLDSFVRNLQPEFSTSSPLPAFPTSLPAPIIDGIIDSIVGRRDHHLVEVDIYNALATVCGLSPAIPADTTTGQYLNATSSVGVGSTNGLSEYFYDEDIALVGKGAGKAAGKKTLSASTAQADLIDGENNSTAKPDGSSSVFGKGSFFMEFEDFASPNNQQQTRRGIRTASSTAVSKDNDDVDSDDIDSGDDAELDSDDEISGNEDSDAENIDDANDEDDEDEDESSIAYEDYEDAMNSELLSSTLSQTFEKMKTFRTTNEDDEDDDNDVGDGGDELGDDDNLDFEDEGEEDSGEVDVEANLVKYFLESQASQLGGAGPASLLLSQLGISLPSVPPPSRPK